MLNMSNKNGATAPHVGSAAEVREAARLAATSAASSPPAPMVIEQPKRRTFTAKYKRGILRKADAALASGTPGGVGALLRQEGLYSSHLTAWRAERDAGELAGLTPKRRGRKPERNPLADEVARLQREIERLRLDLHKAETIIDVQKKLSSLLGVTLATPTDVDFQLRRKR